MFRGSIKFRLPAAALAVVAVGAVAAAPASAKSQAKLVGASNVSLFVEPDSYANPVVQFIDSARKTLDYGIYQIDDSSWGPGKGSPITEALQRARARGVKVRVMATWQTFPANSATTLGDPGSKTEYCEFNPNVPVLQNLAKSGIKTALSPFLYTYYHEKAAIADGNYSYGRALIMDFNSQASYFGPDPKYGGAGARGFGVITSNRADVREIQRVYEADFPPVTVPTSYNRPSLIWSPNGQGFKPKSQGFNRVMQLIGTADKTLDVYVLLLDYAPVRQKLIEATKRGVTVRVIFNTSGPRALTYSQLKEMSDAGVQFAYDPVSPTGSIFVHTKTVLRDAADSDRMAYVGSMNVGDYVSVNAERELGILLSKKQITDTIANTYATDWASASKLQIVGGVPVDPYPEPKGRENYCG